MSRFGLWECIGPLEGPIDEEAQVAISCAVAHHETQGGNRSRMRLLVDGTPQVISSTERSLMNRIRFPAIIASTLVLIILAGDPASAATGAPTLTSVIDNLRNWVVGLLAALATLFLTIGGIRYMLAGGDPGQIERAKSSLRSAAIGYALAALAPILVQIIQSVVSA